MLPEREQREPDRISFEEVLSNAKEVMLKDGQHMPMVIMDTANTILVSHIPDMPATHGERVEFMHFLGQVAAKSGQVEQLDQVFMVSEGWMRETRDENQSKLPPSQDPKRIEVLIISGIQIKDRKKRLELLEVIRDANEKVIGLEEFLPYAETQEEVVEIPLLETFVQGFQTAFRTKYN
jgi:hypothetical protein